MGAEKRRAPEAKIVDEEEEIMSDVKVQALKDGPLLVTGKIALVAADGAPIQTPQESVALCRCGHSGKKPFCDGSHKKMGFKG